MFNTSREIRSQVTSDGQLKLSIESVEMPTPKDHEVLLKVEASPINPSDLGLLISFAADQFYNYRRLWRRQSYNNEYITRFA